MAIMWDAPAPAASLEETAAEVAWRYWLLKALTAANEGDDVRDEELLRVLAASEQPPSTT